jgi:hypothetical protein
MAKITQEELMSQMDFTCARCNAECTKTDPLEPTLAYISKVDGEVVGPLCQACFNIIPEKERVVQNHLEAAFIVAIKAGGEGYAILQEGIEVPFLRNPTVFEIKTSCQEIVDDLKDSKLLTRLVQYIRTQQAPQQSNVVPILGKRR